MAPRSRCSDTCTHETEGECIVALRGLMRARLALPPPTLSTPTPDRRTLPQRRRSPGNEDVLSINEAAELIGMDRSTIFKWLKSGKLKGFWLPSGVRRIHKTELLLLTPPDKQKAGTPEGIPARLAELIEQRKTTSP